MLPSLTLAPGLSELEHEIRRQDDLALLHQYHALALAGEDWQRALEHRLRLVRLEMERRGLAPC